MQIGERVQLNAQAPGGFGGKVGTIVAYLDFQDVLGALGLPTSPSDTHFVFVDLDEPEWDPISEEDLMFGELMGVPHEVTEVSRANPMALIVLNTHVEALQA